MGAGYSVPLSLEEKSKPFRIEHNVINATEYRNHVQDESHTSAKFTVIPVELTNKVTLYRDVDISFNLIQEVPATLPLTLPHLTSLNLSHNLLSSLPEQIFGFIHLENLDVSHNRLTQLPETLVHLDKLTRLDISNNFIRTLPPDMGNLRSIQRINLAFNKLEHLPISLGNIPSLRVVLANNNEFVTELRALCDLEPCQLLISHLKDCYNSSRVREVGSRLNRFQRDRGPVFDSKILNSGSAQSFFTQMQSQSVNTGNRILTPMIPPPDASSLDLEHLKDAILGLFYGAVVGDSLGILTEFMTPSEAEFFYDREELDSPRMHVDEHRCHYSVGEVSLSSRLVLLVLDSVLAWGGVVDELDYATRLSTLLSCSEKPLFSHVLESVVLGGGEGPATFRADPRRVAAAWRDSNSGQENVYLVCDNLCLPPLLGLVVSQFHDIQEVVGNASRICSSTHSHQDNLTSATFLAQLLARLLQGEDLQTALGVHLNPDSVWPPPSTHHNSCPTATAAVAAADSYPTTATAAADSCPTTATTVSSPTPPPSPPGGGVGGLPACIARDISHPWTCLQHLHSAISVYTDPEATASEVGLQRRQQRNEGEGGGSGASRAGTPGFAGGLGEFCPRERFHRALLGVIMQGGHSSVNGCVVGAVLGLVSGFQAIHPPWIARIEPGFRRVLDKKLNHLFDNMGIP